MFKVNSRLTAVAIAIGTLLPLVASAEPNSKNGAVFVMTNAAEKNEIIAFERSLNGSLTEVERYDTQGRGSSGITDPLGSQGSLRLSQDQSLLFAVNSGSGNISVFGVRHSTLAFLDKVPSGGSEPVAIAEDQSLVYVLNAGGAGSLVGFKLDFGGHLRQIKGSTTFLTAAASGGASLAFSPNGRFLVVTEKVPNNVDVFRVNPDGTLGPVVVNPNPDPGTFAVSFTPGGSLIVSETGTPGVADSATISSFNVLNNGKLSSISEHVPTLGTANCWNAVTPDGKFVYVSNAGTSSISGFAIAKNGTLTPLSGTVVGNNPQGSTNLDIAVSSDGKFVYTLNSASGEIGIFGIESDGSLVNLGTSGQFPKSEGFNGIAAL
jgi:6-phosphogluconolactonase (cycloisomerase 2 family)